MWAAVDRGRVAVIELLNNLGPDEWARSSLCEGWTVHDVAAHLTMPLLSKRQLLTLAVRYPGSTNRIIRDGSRYLARKHDRRQVLERLSGLVGHHTTFPGLSVHEALIDVLGHTLDIAIPNGRDARLDPDAVAIAADRVISYGGRGNAKVFRTLPLSGIRLVATDHDWSTGSGPTATGSMADIFLLLTGRPAGADRLTGPGADAIRSRLADRSTVRR